MDLSSPKSAAKSILAAVAAKDVDAVRSSLDGDKEFTTVLAELLVASNRMSEAGVKRFGKSGDPLGRPMITPTDAGNVEAALVNQTGDVATIQVAGQRRAMIFRQRGSEWKLVPDALLGADAAKSQAPPQLINMLRNMTIAMNELARDISEGKYQTSQDAERYVQEKLHAVMIETFKPDRTRPTTQPATAASSRPTTRR